MAVKQNAVKLPNGKNAIVFPTTASVLFHDAVQLAENIDFLLSGQFSGQELILATIVKQPEQDLSSKTHAGEAVLVFTPKPVPIPPSSE